MKGNIYLITLFRSFLPLSQDLFSINAYVYAQKPQLDIHSFEGNFTRVSGSLTSHCQTNVKGT